MITPRTSIPELLKMISHSFTEPQFNEVQQILIDREKMMLFDIEDSKRALDSVKIEARLQERSHIITEMELNAKVTRLTEELRASSDRAKRAEERHEKLSKESSNIIAEKDKLIDELNGKIKEFQGKNLENEQYKEELKSLEAKVANLRAEKLASDQLVDELKSQMCEATRNLDELMQGKMESDSRLENLAPRVIRMETELASLLNVKVENLDSLSDFMDKFAPKEEKVDLPNTIKRWKDSLEIDSTNAVSENVGTSNFGGIDDTPFVMKGSRDIDTRTPGETRCAGKRPISSCAPLEVIEIGDSDDEAESVGSMYMSDASSGENKRRLEKGEKCSQSTQHQWHFSSESD